MYLTSRKCFNATRPGHVDEAALVAFYTAGLPKEYDPFCQSIEASSETISADEVRQRIRDVYERKNQDENCDFGENSVPVFFSRNAGNRPRFGAKRRGQANSRGRGKGSLCFNCGKYGHISPECEGDEDIPRRPRYVNNNNQHSNGSFKSRNRHRANVALEDDDDDDETMASASLSVGKVTAAFMVYPESSDTIFRGWYIDYGATRHMATDKVKFVNMRKSNVISITVADKGIIKVHGQGDVHIKTSSNEIVLLTNVLYVHDLAANLISVGCIDKKGGSVSFQNSKCKNAKFLTAKISL